MGGGGGRTRGKRVPEHWDGANWLVHCPLKSPSWYRLRFTGHIYAPTFQDDQLNGNDREISRQKQTFSHVSRSAGLTHADRRPPAYDCPDFGTESREIERAMIAERNRAVACIALTIQRAASMEIGLQGMYTRLSVSLDVSVAVLYSSSAGTGIIILFSLSLSSFLLLYEDDAGKCSNTGCHIVSFVLEMFKFIAVCCVGGEWDVHFDSL